MNLSFRMVVLRCHRWAGLSVGLLMALIGLTGAAIVFRPQLEPVLNLDLLTVPACVARVPLDTLAANSTAVRPHATLDYVRLLAGDPGAARIPAAQVRFTDQTFVYLNPCTGVVLGVRARYGGVLGFIEQVHRFRFMPHGSLITGTGAIVFSIVLVVGGLFMWWPSRLRAWKHAVSFDGRLTGAARMLSLHKTVGLYASAIVLVSALTGLPQAFDWYAHAIYVLTGSREPVKEHKSAPFAGAKRLPMEASWQIAQALVPQPSEALLHFPRRARDPVEIYLIAHDAPHANARTMLFLDAYTGKPLEFTPYADSSLGNKVYFWALSWHTGRVGGLFGQLVLLVGALCLPVLAYTGISRYIRRKRKVSPRYGRLTVQVARKDVEAAGICTLTLVAPSGKPLPPFDAGAHIDVCLRNSLVRQYSLCNDPRETHRYVICVLRVPVSRGGSAAIHDDIEAGDFIEISEPRNHFVLERSAPRSLLLAGGIGITPIICMAERLASIGADFEMHYCNRSAERTAFIERIARSAYADRVSYHFSDGPAAQRLDLPTILDRQPPGTHLYVCGPDGFMDRAIDTAMQNGWPDGLVHREHFSASAYAPEAAAAFDVRIASTGKVYRVAETQSVVQALSESGVAIPTSCTQGVCGTCVTRVIEGEVDHRDLCLTTEERARNDRFTPCCSRARGALLVLDL
ncbi:flavodoxin reductase [Paraburkholderia steynii]|uniref:Flavodoxin reductase n=1 Tax=Paraburkholderia steynii TaxID=1245441 RepID=A0A4R0XFB1_9BURK|nr:flavodoxin reductase [Paraburkholderia steynii]